MLTQERLKELYSYDKRSGKFTRKISTSNRAKVGEVNTSKFDRGYYRIGIDGKRYLAHLLAWLYEYGSFPKKQIDHINHNPSDNRIENLREVTNKQNGQNAKLNRRNKSGKTGVSMTKEGTWVAKIGVDFRSVHLGTFKHKNEAIVARTAAEKLHQFHPNHGGL